jgi:hypothetical protein
LFTIQITSASIAPTQQTIKPAKSRNNKEIPTMRLKVVTALGLGVFFSLTARTQELIYKEDFNTDGSATRYTVVGGDVYEPDRIRSELGIQDQLGPIYWARSSDISFVGVPGATPGRRAILTWNGTMDPASVTISPQFGQLFDSIVTWLTKGKANPRVLYSASLASVPPGDQYLLDRLTAKGATLTEDPAVSGGTSTALPAATDFDLVLKSSAGDAGIPSRYARFPVPMLIYNAADLDDELVSSIGQSAQTIDIPAINIATNHPAAGSLTGSIPLITGGSGTFDTIGDFLPE